MRFRSKLNYLPLALLQLCFAPEVKLEDIFCKDDVDCCKTEVEYDQKFLVICAICVNGKCEQVLTDQFKTGLPCTWERKPCAPEYCLNGQKSWEGFGDCICYCDTNPNPAYRHFGKKCNKTYTFYTKPNDEYPYGIQFFTPAFVIYMVFRFGPHIVVTIDSNSPAPALYIQDTSGGFVVRVNRPDYDFSNRFTYTKCVDFIQNQGHLSCPEMCKMFLNFDRVYLVFIIPFLIPLRYDYKYAVHLRSWTVRELKMEVRQQYVGGLPLVETTTRKYIVGRYPYSQEELDKYPIVNINNCGETLDQVQKYYFNEDIRLSPRVSMYNKQLDALESLPQGDYDYFSSWRMYKFREDTRTSIQNPERTQLDHVPKYFDIKRFTHFPDTFVVNLSMTITYWDRKYKDGRKSFTNFNICVFSIEWAPVVAVLAGGSYRSVYADTELVLDADASGNPNDVDHPYVSVSLELRCNWTEESVCGVQRLGYVGGKYSRVSAASHPAFGYIFVIKPNELISNRAYEFTLTVFATAPAAPKGYEGPKPSVAKQIIYVLGDTDKAKHAEKPEIICVYNCKPKSNPKDIIYLQVKGNWTKLHRIKYSWFLQTKTGVKTEIGAIRQNGTSSFILIINDGSFQEKRRHEIGVRYEDTLLVSVYIITTSFASPFTCRIDPQTGVAGLTRFDITCKLTTWSRFFEFYDKHENDEPNSSGRMFSFQKSGVVQDLILTRGKVEIHSFDKYGLDTVFTLNVMLSKRNTTLANIYKLLDDLIKRSDNQEVGYTLSTASVVCDLLTTMEEDVGFSKPYLYESLLRSLSKLSIEGYGYAKLGIYTLHNTLLAGRGSLTLESVLYASRTIRTLAHALATGLKENTPCTFSTLYQILGLFLDCIFIVLETEENLIGSKDFPLYNIIPVNPRVKEITRNVLRSSYHLQSALSYRQLPGQKGKLIQSKLGNITLWSKVDVPDSISSYSRDEYRKGTLPVIVPDALAKDATEMGMYIALQYMSFKRDPTFQFKINTRDALDVSVCFKGNYGQTCKYPKVLKNGVQVAIKISDIISHEFTELSLKRLDGGLDSDWLDEKLPVYKLDAIPPVDMLSIFRFNSTNTTVYVAVKQDTRPTYGSLLTEKHELSHEKSIYQIAYNTTEEPHLYYLAIQSSNQVKVNETIIVGVKIFSKSCYTWHNHWTAKGCQSVAYPHTDTVICECNRLSLIGGLIQEVVPKLDIVQNMPLFLTINGIHVEKMAGLLLVLLTFALLAFLCARADRADKSRRFVSILPDNLPGDRYGYLVCVVTGARFGAGTDAAVGVRLYGTTNDGRRHILSNEKHEVMKSMGEDWFLISESEKLGKITYVYLWHDNSGAKPDWFCDYITIYDLHRTDCYFFYVNDWITLSLHSIPDITLFPTPLSTVLGPPKTFYDNFRLGFQVSHLWFDTFFKHPRDPVTRIDRLAIALCFVFVSLAASIIFIKMSDNYIEVDDFFYSMTKPMIKIGVCTSVLAATVACVLMHMCRKIYKITFYEKKRRKKGSENSVISTRFSTISQSSVVSLEDDKDYIHYGRRHKHSRRAERKKTLAEVINFTLLPKPLVPVQLEGDEPNVIVQTNWLVTTCTTFLLVVIICFIVSILLSKDLSPIKTLKWISIVGIAVLIHALVLQPLKITLTSTILAVAFKRVIIYKDVYSFDPNQGRQQHYFGNVKYLARFVALRSKLMYQPLHEVFREEHRRTMVKASQWRSLYELTVQTLVLVLLGALLSKNMHTKYQTNAFHKRLDKFYMFNMTDLKSFQYSSETYFFKYDWYNCGIVSLDSELNFFRKDWMYDYVDRVVGKIRLRQFRVSPGYCKAPVNLTIDCAAPFSRRSKDTGNYFPFWMKDVNITDSHIGIDLFRKWTYHWPSDEENFYFEGKTSQVYRSGGYMWDLQASSEDMDASLTRLWEEWWIDYYTRAVILEVTVYNVNTRLFSELVLLSEQTIAGQIISVTLVDSVDINIEFDWLLVLYICFVFMMCARIFKLANYVGAWGFLKNWRRPYEIILAANGLAVLLYLVMHLLKVPEYVEEYQLHSNELQHFNFYRISHSKFTARSLLCVLYILNLVTFYSLWRFGKTSYRYLLTLKFTTEIILWCVGLFILFQFLFYRIVGYILCMFVDSVFNPNMIYKFNYLHSSSSNIYGGSIFRFITSYSCVIVMILYAMIFVGHYKNSKYEVLRHWGIFSYVSLIKNEIVELLHIPAVRRTTFRVGRTIAPLHEVKKSETRLKGH